MEYAAGLFGLILGWKAASDVSKGDYNLLIFFIQFVVIAYFLIRNEGK